MTSYTNIQKYDTYNERMARSMLDKIFFLDKVDASVFVDFGCADGTLFKHMKTFLPDTATLIGYDNHPNMGDLVSKHIANGFYSKWSGLADQIISMREGGKRVCLILSSVIHEVYHYGTVQDIDTFWTDVFGVGFDYLVIRDMIPSETIDRKADVNDVAKVLRKFRDTKELRDFERLWGSINRNKNLVHFLLKYKYLQPNWEREVKENYLPLYWEDLMARLPKEYNILYHEHGSLPYIKRSIQTDFGIELKDATHLKLILENNAR